MWWLAPLASLLRVVARPVFGHEGRVRDLLEKRDGVGSSAPID
jgi:hypothetical protein